MLNEFVAFLELGAGRRIARAQPRALAAGSLANLMSAALAGLLLPL